jgi:hypothetical protein
MSKAIDVLKTELLTSKNNLKDVKAAEQDAITEGKRAERRVREAESSVTDLEVALAAVERVQSHGQANA